ncbi:MAG TPA: cyclopropane-fatty-acyl-phospholipid synthase family protein [Pirellulales bacterium]|jgi:cyclopropane-fatty-acyl-phospholipid synthase|nr:cyclopropane-fatty-acyl-phospholipid synthase family protein [Pirellulales bacterium]
MTQVARNPSAETVDGSGSTAVEPDRVCTVGHESRTTQCSEQTSGVTNLERWLLRRILQGLGNPPIEIALWTGEAVATCSSPPVATMRIRDRRTLWKLLGDPRFQFGEAYSDGRLEVEGKLVDLLVAVDCALVQSGKIDFGVKGISRWLHKPRRTTLVQARENVHHHYDLGNDFYKLWLDEQLLYTCAYFAEPTMSLEQAQVAKLDHVCRKIWLQAGESVIEAGCGWGALALHMARCYGAKVRAFNTSREQILFARERARDEGLQDRVEFIEDDWRNIAGECDAFVSVGMLEHVGPANYGELGDVMHRCLKREGRGLIHSIGRNRPHPTDPWIERRIFPGAYPPALSEMTSIFEPHGFSVLDVENLRPHYAETLRHWLARFEAAYHRIVRMFDERFARMWRLYLAGSMAAFEAGCLQLFQLTFATGSSRQSPRTRAHIYARRELAPERFDPPNRQESIPCSDVTS